MIIVLTSDLARAYACKSKARFETAAVAITVLTQRVASERCRCTLAILTRVTPCALVAIIACRALAVCPRARTGASFAPLTIVSWPVLIRSVTCPLATVHDYTVSWF